MKYNPFEGLQHPRARHFERERSRRERSVEEVSERITLGEKSLLCRTCITVPYTGTFTNHDAKGSKQLLLLSMAFRGNFGIPHLFLHGRLHIYVRKIHARSEFTHCYVEACTFC